MMNISSAPHAADAERRMIYEPADALGFTAWTDCFDYQNGRLGLSFKEIRRAHDAAFVPPRLEMGEAIGAPVSYCSAECGSADTVSERVYMASDDGGEHWYETGRCPLAEGSFLNAGFADGRLVGLDVGRVNAARTGWCDYIAVRESTDGGSTWTETARLLEGCAVYLWRLRRLRDGSLLVLASFYGTPWGIGCERATRNTMLPGETYLNKIQPFSSIVPTAGAFRGRTMSFRALARMSTTRQSCLTDGFCSWRATCRARRSGGSSSAARRRASSTGRCCPSARAPRQSLRKIRRAASSRKASCACRAMFSSVRGEVSPSAAPAISARHGR